MNMDRLAQQVPKPMYFQIVLLAFFCGTQLAYGNVAFQTAPNLNLAIPDDGYSGTLASMACANIVVSGVSTYTVDGNPSVKVWIDHTWIGDLVVKLVSPQSTTVTLMSRPGFIETADDGTGGYGDNSNLLSSVPIEFVSSGPKSAESMGDTLSDAQVVCRDDAACGYAPDKGAAAQGNLSSFFGQTASGTWKLCVGDSGAGDSGVIQQVQLTFPLQRYLEASPQTQDFGAVVQGATSVERFVTLEAGFADVTVNSLTLAAAPFVRDIDGTCGNSLPHVIKGNTQCTLGYRFEPTTQDSLSQQFTLQSDATLGTSAFTLKGSGDAVFVNGFDP